MIKELGIIILNYNTPNDVLSCVKSIKRTTHIDYRIYIVDNASTDNSISVFEEKFSRDEEIVIISSERNGGFSAGNNIGGFRAVKDGCEFLLFTNSDIIFYDQAIDSLLKEMKENTDVGIIGPKIETPDSKRSEFARRKLTTKEFLLTKKPLCYLKGVSNRYIDIKYDEKGLFKFAGMVSGCCFIMRTDTYRDNSGFDESLFLYGEEDVWAYKLEEKGLLAAVVNDATVYHNHHNSIKRKGSAFTRYYQWISPLIVLSKYSKIKKPMLWMLCFNNILTWTLISFTDKNYKDLKKQFIEENRELVKK